jgi:CTP-dependent riboflavin kinase
MEIKTMKLQGVVQEGKGDASFWLSKYSDVYQLWTGMALIPGSLNVHLTAKFDWTDSSIEPFKKIYSLAPYGGNRDICLIPCEIYKEDKDKIYGFAWATTNAANDPDYKVLETIASVRLRDVLQLNNGSVVTIDIPVLWKG